MKKGSSGPKRPRLDSGTWAMLLEVQEGGDLSVKDFCVSQDLSMASFYQWRNRLRGGKVAGECLFSPIEIQEKPSGITVELPGGVLLRFSQLPPVGYLRELSSKFSGC